jgi:tetratricopeptide (TPR) repeat protein
MSVLSGLLKHLGAKAAGRRTWTPLEVRELLDRRQIDEAEQAVERLSLETPERDRVLLCLRGEVAFRRHDDQRAEGLFREALTLAPGLADAHYGLSLVMLARGDRQSAVRHAQFAANNGDAARFRAQLGLCHLELGNIKRAGDALYQATTMDPNDKSSWNNLGIARRAVGDLRGARTAFARALEIDPHFEQAAANARLLETDAHHLGKTLVADAKAAGSGLSDPRLAAVLELAEAGDVSRAIDECEQLSTRHPDESVFVIELARLYERAGDARTAFDVFRAFRVRQPDDVDAIAALGLMLVRQDNFKGAAPLLERALQDRPDDTDLLLAMAEVRWSQMRYEDAGQYIERASELTPSIHMKGRLAANLLARCRYEEALKVLDDMVAEDPAVESGIVPLRCNALTYLGRYDELLPDLEEAIRRHPHDPYRRFSRASIHLLNERFELGWQDYAYRNLESTKHLRMLPFPLWDGQSLEGRTILVSAEQGLGDQVMFASCLPDLLRLKPARVIVEAIDRVAPTLARSFPSCEVVATRQDSQLDWVKSLGHVDTFVMMGDLPRFFRNRREDFPAHAGYLVPDAQRVAHWRSQFDALDGGRRPRIGISWRGGTEATRRVVRTMDIADFKTIHEALDATWVCLQYGEVAKDLERADELGMALEYWPESIKDLDDFAACISALDLVITVCNTTVHYSGAVGRPVWVLAPKIPEWRYGLHSTSMPWYPSSRLFRQTDAGDWGALVHRVAAGLKDWSQESGAEAK